MVRIFGELEQCRVCGGDIRPEDQRVRRRDGFAHIYGTCRSRESHPEEKGKSSMSPGPTETLEVKIAGLEGIATFPHCDSRVLHAPGTCRYCDRHPEWQAYRRGAGINFTGQQEEGLAPCPSDAARGVGGAHTWPGNRPVSPPKITEGVELGSRARDLEAAPPPRPSKRTVWLKGGPVPTSEAPPVILPAVGRRPPRFLRLRNAIRVWLGIEPLQIK